MIGFREFEKNILNAITYEWCYVNTDNEFIFMNNIFVIDESIEDYKVYRKAGEIDEYTNESAMEEVLAVIDDSYKLKFYNQKYQLINVEHINVKTKAKE